MTALCAKSVRAVKQAASDLWGLMQLVETNRHQAEKLEEAAALSGGEKHRFITEIASQHREIAAQFNALSLDTTEIPKLTFRRLCSLEIGTDRKSD
jgi:hypothetical protein